MHVDLCRRGLRSFDPAEFAHTDEHLQILLQVRQLDLSHNSLYTIRGLEGLTQLTTLNLSHNGLRLLSGGLPLSLEVLDASHNDLGSLQNASLLPLRSLTFLDVSFNRLEDLRGVPNITAQLTHLDVRSNRLGSLAGVEHCAQLLTLHAEANLLREVSDVASLRCLSNLHSVFLSGNPLLLRKRLLAQVRLLLPPTVEHDDVPTTAPPSSVRSSTAAPLSVRDGSSVCSLEHSAVVSLNESRDERQCGCSADGRPGRRDAVQRATPSRIGASTLSTRLRNPPAALGDPSQQRLPCTSSLPSEKNARLLPAPEAASPRTTRVAVGVVGGASDSPTCPRRALPQEHTLAVSPSSTSASSSQDGTRMTNASAAPMHRNFTTQPQTTANEATGSRTALAVNHLEELLRRVTEERDDYQREVIALRKQLQNMRVLLQQKEGRAPLNRHHSNNDDDPTNAWHLLAVEMSTNVSAGSEKGYSSAASIDGGHNRGRAPSASSPARIEATSLNHRDVSGKTKHTSISATVPLQKIDRRDVAALFMAKLQSNGASA